MTETYKRDVNKNDLYGEGEGEASLAAAKRKEEFYQLDEGKKGNWEEYVPGSCRCPLLRVGGRHFRWQTLERGS